MEQERYQQTLLPKPSSQAGESLVTTPAGLTAPRRLLPRPSRGCAVTAWAVSLLPLDHLNPYGLRGGFAQIGRQPWKLRQKTRKKPRKTNRQNRQTPYIYMSVQENTPVQVPKPSSQAGEHLNAPPAGLTAPGRLAEVESSWLRVPEHQNGRSPTV